MDPELAHRIAVRACDIAGHSNLLRSIVRPRLTVTNSRLEQTIGGVRFENPIGLAAGFDKNGYAVEMLGAFGFGHVEIGSISAFPSKGNPSPRLFRIPNDKGIVVNYGVPNEGADRVAKRLGQKQWMVPLGINLVKTNDSSRPTSDEEVIGDYATSFGRLQGYGSYVSLNMSCPNSPNDRNYFDDLTKVDALLQRLSRSSPQLPVFLKLKPTTDKGILKETVAIADRYPFVAGFGINLPAGKPAELIFATSQKVLARLPGSVSGRPVEGLINSNLRLLYEVIGRQSRYRLMAAGGVFSAADAYRKIRLGASLVQIYTALVYYGPGVVKEILEGLLELLSRDGFRQISDAVGEDVR
jgi:dihydroorotate dehydrogenase